MVKYYLTCYSGYSQAAVLAMDESVLDVDQVENLIKFCPTKEEMELLKVKLNKFIHSSYITFCQLRFLIPGIYCHTETYLYSDLFAYLILIPLVYDY